jgi:hypothetical protein
MIPFFFLLSSQTNAIILIHIKATMRALLILLLSFYCTCWAWNSSILTRRAWCWTTTASSFFVPLSAQAATPQVLLEELKECKVKLEPIPDLLEQMEWDKVRSILKVPPVNKLWNLGDVSFFKVCESCILLLKKKRLTVRAQVSKYRRTIGQTRR